MPDFDIVREYTPNKSFRVASVIDTFDLQEGTIKEHFAGRIDIPKEWQIGIIIGNSGTGKTTIAKELFPDAYVTNFEYNDDCVMDNMPESKSVKEICQTFNSVGFSSPPSWLKPYKVLSNGERMRVDLARAILSDDDLFVFDEFTSVVDRNVAKIGSFAMQKAIRKSKKKFIAVSCHFDVEDWLLPDWVFDTNSMTFRLCEGQKKNRPQLNFRIYEVFGAQNKTKYWNMFSRYHYLSHSHNNAARVFIATLNDEVCAFTSVLPFPHPIVKNTWKGHRTVVFPDYQGIGLGLTIANHIAEIFKKENKIIIRTTSNPAYINSLRKSPNWIMTHHGRTSRGSDTGKIQNKHIKGSTSSNRITCSFKYVG